MTRTTRTLLLIATFGALLVGVVAGALSAMPNLPTATAQADALPVAEPMRIDAIPADQPTGTVYAYELDDVDRAFLASLFGSGTSYTPEQGVDLVLAAHRVCEGITAGVPVVDMAAVLTEQHGLTDTEARVFIGGAATVYCSAPAA